MSLGPCCFLTSKWKNVFLVSRLNHPCFTVSHPPAMQCREEPGSAGSVLLLTPPGYPCGWGKGSNRFPPATGCASVQRAAGFPRWLTFNLPKKQCKIGTNFSVPQTPRSPCLLYHRKFIRYYYSSLWRTKLSVCKQREWKNNPCEISHINFTAGGVRGN